MQERGLPGCHACTAAAAALLHFTAADLTPPGNFALRQRYPHPNRSVLERMTVLCLRIPTPAAFTSQKIMNATPAALLLRRKRCPSS